MRKQAILRRGESNRLKKHAVEYGYRASMEINSAELHNDIRRFTGPADRTLAYQKYGGHQPH